MSRVKATVNFIHAWQHPDEIADEVEAELRFHVQMRTQANIECKFGNKLTGIGNLLHSV